MSKDYFVLRGGRVVYKPGHYDIGDAQRVADLEREAHPRATVTIVHKVADYRGAPARSNLKPQNLEPEAMSWTTTTRAGRVTYSRETPAGRVVVKQTTLSSRATVWQAVFPDGGTKNESEAEDAKAYADTWIARLSPSVTK